MKSKVTFALLVAILMHSAPAIAKDSDEGRRYIKIYGGTNFLSDKSYDQANVAAVGATGTSSFDAGMIAGLASIITAILMFCAGVYEIARD